MIVVRETSAGTIVVDFSYVTRSVGVAAAVGRVDDQGWAVDLVRWNAGAGEGRSLADAIREAVSVPQPEAEDLANSALRELHERGGDKSDMTRRDWLQAGALLTTSAGIVFVVILAAVAVLIWGAIKLI